MRCPASIVIGILLWSFGVAPVLAQIVVLREGAEAITLAVGRYLGKKTASETAEEIAKIGGKEFVEGMARRTIAEGGEEALRRVVSNTAKYGPEYVRVLGKAPSPVTLAKTLDELPADSVKRAVGLLGNKGSGEALQSLVQKTGVRALEADLAHPGIGASLVENLGDEGYRLATTLNGNEVVNLGRCAPAIARLPESEKAGVLKLLHDDATRMVSFMGRFIEKNPGKVLFTPAATLVILRNSEALLGGDDIVLDAEGNPVVVSKPGALGRGGKALLDRLDVLAVVALSLVSVAVVAWLSMRLYFLYQHQSLRLEQSKREGCGRTTRGAGKAAHGEDRSQTP